MLKSLIAALLCVFIAGCDTVSKIETVQIAVPIPTKPECPQDVCKEPDIGPLPEFKTDPAHPTWAYLDEEGQARLRALTITLKGALDTVLTWAKAP